MIGQKFNVSEAPLTSSNLIEASAGTGKTYSISMLMLRFVIEKGYLPHQLILVTFTNSAVAEIDGRVRELLQQAYRISLGEIDRDENDLVWQLIDRAFKEHKEEVVVLRLKLAVLAIDDAWICTIHSFCQRVLTEFSFETKQMFGVSFVTSEQEMKEKVVHQFWREEIVSLPKNVLLELIRLSVQPNYFSAILSDALQDKKYIASSFNELSEGIEKLADVTDDLEALKETCLAYISNNKEEIISLIETKSHAKKNLLPIDSDEDFFAKYISVLDKKYAQVLPDFFEQVQEYVAKIEEKEQVLFKIIATLNIRLITKGKQHINELKKQFSVMNYDDLMRKMWLASTENKEVLRDLLQRKFRAVFVDEFQDTDQAQYEIFDNLFGSSSTTLFYIGDPKQSIYSFRKADLNTYKRAKKAVKNVYTMSVNYRSTPKLIDTFNVFFDPNEDFNAFLDDEIQYQKVSAGKKELGDLTVRGEQVKAISVNPVPYSGAPSILSVLVGQVVELLQDGEINDRKVIPSDIGVLVRGKKKAQEIKQALADQGVPSVTIDDTKVLSSTEVNYLLYLLEATVDPSVRTINKALLSQYHGIGLGDLTKVDELLSIQFFLEAKRECDQKGVFKLIHYFVERLGLINSLNEKGITGKRALVNIFHLSELLHHQEKQKKASLTDLIGWLQKTSQNERIEGDEFEQRIESDEQAVQIVTIHKSKGLAYNIVFAPQLDLSPMKKYGLPNISSFLEDGEYVFTDNPTDDQKELLEFTEQQENRRLLYVALTRAVYKCYLFYKSTKTLNSEVLINSFVTELKEKKHPEIEFTDSEVRVDFPYKDTSVTVKNLVKFTNSELNYFNLLNSWKLLSFSGLNSIHKPYSYQILQPSLTDYDEFIFNKVPKGALTGDFLHLLFEKSDFTKSQYFEKTLERVAPFYESIYDESLKSDYVKLFNQVVGGVLPSGFSLNQIQNSKRLNEMKFHYPINQFQLSQISQQFPNIVTTSNVDYMGMMHGFIDLFFEHEGKYYVLDWKSNSLGNSLESYTGEHLKNAMSDNGYLLQGLIYSYASCLYLQSRVEKFDINTQFGGFIYVFLRGVRSGEETGMYHQDFNKVDFDKMDDIMNNSV